MVNHSGKTDALQAVKYLKIKLKYFEISRFRFYFGNAKQHLIETLCICIQSTVDRKFVIHGCENFKSYMKSKFNIKI